MKKRRAILMGVLMLLLLSMHGCGINKTITLKHIAYDNEKKNYIIYLKESNEYVPYLVLDSNYNGNVLVLRQNVLPEMMQYKEHDNTWAFAEYGSYYEESSVDEYLNTDFLNSLSEVTIESVVESTITVTDKEA